MRRLILAIALVTFAFLGRDTSVQALIGTPCDPDTDFSEIYLIRNWKALPHKNQEETSARCAEVNRRAKKTLWKFNPAPNTPLYACLSYGASSMADWWAQELGLQLGTYRSYTNGSMETGFNPRKLEVRYRKRAKWNLLQYTMIRLYEKDPITSEPVPIRPSGYARLLTDTSTETLPDPIDGTSFTYQKSDYPMEGTWYSVISKNWDRKSAEKKLCQALHDFGPLYIQFEIPKKHYLMGTHAPIVIGYGKLPGATSNVFIVHDSFGNHPKSYVQDGNGASAYRYITAGEIDEAIVFPHTPVAKLVTSPKGKAITFENSAGKPIPVRQAWCNGPVGKPIPMLLVRPDLAVIPEELQGRTEWKVYVEADCYMKKDGKGHWLTVKTQP